MSDFNLIREYILQKDGLLRAVNGKLKDKLFRPAFKDGKLWRLIPDDEPALTKEFIPFRYYDAVIQSWDNKELALLTEDYYYSLADSLKQ